GPGVPHRSSGPRPTRDRPGGAGGPRSAGWSTSPRPSPPPLPLPLLSSQRVVLIHQFDECHGVVSLSHGKRQRDQYDNSSCALRSASPTQVRVEAFGAEVTSATATSNGVSVLCAMGSSACARRSVKRRSARSSYKKQQV